MKNVAAYIVCPFAIAVIFASAIACSLFDVRKEGESVGTFAVVLLSAADRFPGSIYDNQDQLPGASGEVLVSQPPNHTEVAVAVSAHGLLPDANYSAYIDTNGTGASEPYSFGPWVGIGAFKSDQAGHGDGNFTLPASDYQPGPHTWSVYINRADHGATILVSDDIAVQLAPGS